MTMKSLLKTGLKKKANIPVTILVIGIFVLCVLAVISFLVSKIYTREAYSGTDLMENINAQIETYLVGGSFEGFDTRVGADGRVVLYQEKKEGRVIFSVEYPVGG